MRWLVATLVALSLVPAATAAAAVTPGWTSVPPLAEPRMWAEAVLLDDGRVLVAGGRLTNGGLVRATTELFDPRTGTWARGASMVKPRWGFGLAKLADGRVLAAGGAGLDDRSTEIYDPARNTWGVVGTMNTRRDSPMLLALADGRAVAIGGDHTAEVFDPASSTWSAPTPLFTRTRANVVGVALPGNRVLVAGGTAMNGIGYDYFADAMILGPDGRNAIADLRTGRHGHQLTALLDGRVLATGGYGTAGHASAAEIYDSRTNRWEPAGQTSAVRDNVAGVTLMDGTVLFAGGEVLGEPVSSTERYLPATNSWTPGDILLAPRSSHTATRLADGRVLVAGGIPAAGYGPAIDSAELWAPLATVTVTPSLDAGARGVGATGTAALSLTNAGDQPLVTEGYAISGPAAGDFTVDPARCRSVAAGAACTADVRFTPTATGVRTATLTFAANTAGGAHTVTLSGVGVTTADRDRDGITDAADRCAGRAGPASRSGCPKGLLNDPSIRYQRLRRGIKVLAYYVKATTGAKITVTCTKRACKRGTATGRGAKPVRIKVLDHRRLANGTRITVKVTKRDRLTTTVVDRVAKSRRTEGRPRCTPVGC